MVHLKLLLLYNWRTMNTEKLKTETNSFGCTKCSKALVITASHVRVLLDSWLVTLVTFEEGLSYETSDFPVSSAICAAAHKCSDSIKCLCLLRFRLSDVLSNQLKHLINWSWRRRGRAKCYIYDSSSGDLRFFFKLNDHSLTTEIFRDPLSLKV